VNLCPHCKKAMSFINGRWVCLEKSPEHQGDYRPLKMHDSTDYRDTIERRYV